MKNKLHKRSSAFVVVLLMVLSMLPGTITQVRAEEYVDWDGTAAFEDGGCYKLTSDLTIDTAYQISGISVTIDLNGKKITSSAETGHRAFKVGGTSAGGSLTLKNGTIEMAGLEGNGGILHVQYGDLVLDGMQLIKSGFTAESTTYSGGILYAIGNTSYPTSVNVTNTTMQWDETSTGSVRMGGVIYSTTGSTLEINNSTIANGTAVNGNALAGAGSSVISVNSGTVGQTYQSSSAGTFTMNGGSIEKITIKGIFNMFGGELTTLTTSGSAYTIALCNGTTGFNPSAYRSACACYRAEGDGYTLWHIPGDGACSTCGHTYTGANTGSHTYTDGVCTVCAAEEPVIQEKLSWAGINSFPVKSGDMTTAELRQLCVDFFRYTKTALWTPDETVNFVRNSSGSKDSVNVGTVYGGLPYVGLGSGNIYRLMDYMDTSTGSVDMSQVLWDTDDGMKLLKYFGNQCSIGAYWGWGRVINSATYDWTQNMVQSKGFLRVGPYTYDDTRTKWSSTTEDRTTYVCTTNGEQTMYQSYAQLQLGDGLVYYTSAGHVIMCSAAPYVVYNEDGTIDGANSYIYIIDQAQTWVERTNDSGDTYEMKKNVDAKKTFQQLFSGSYLPFTFAEFLGTDEVEDTVCTYSLSGASISVEELFSSKVTANYGISDIYAIVTDSSGNEIYRHVVRATKAGKMELSFVQEAENVDTWGALTLSDGETYTLQIVAQLATGERPTVYNGQLKMEN